MAKKAAWILFENTIIPDTHPFSKESTLLATSLCGDEVNRDMEDEMRTAIMGGHEQSHFTTGGLAGFCFAGVAGFAGMVHHIPVGGNCVVFYGPHVGVDYDGTVGKVNRKGHPMGSGTCCGPANAALAYVKQVMAGTRAPVDHPTDILDSQQTWVNKELLPYGERICSKAGGTDRGEHVELPLALYEAQDAIMMRILTKVFGEMAGDGKIVLLGGVTINTPEGTPEYFLPKKFQIFTKGDEGNCDPVMLEDRLDELLATQAPKVRGASNLNGGGTHTYG